MSFKSSHYLLACLTIALCGLLIIAPASAKEKQNNQASSSPQPSSQGRINSAPQQGQDMMGQANMPGGSGQGMMSSDQGGGMDMMGKNSSGKMGKMSRMMMRMMKAHTMGGPGGMGRMMGGMNHGHGKGMNGGMIARMTTMLDQLNLTPDQWEKVRNAARLSLEKMVDLWAQHTKLEIELSSLRWDQKVDAQKIKKLFADQAEAKAEMFLASMKYMRTLNSVLTPSQAKKLQGALSSAESK
ncbi:MAG: hypothetical protein KQI62_07430 [Deltaproteobacteria bacterium]|nr:hypothetical protein [Deltaproteobacteria bacterium]